MLRSLVATQTVSKQDRQLPHILGTQRQGDADYLEGCRQKRNTVEYDNAGGATRRDAEDLIAFGHELRAEVLAWLREMHPGLAPE